ncbi:lipopolysaccharide biosynthesis protein [Saccharicrinis fermentans]|uniref:Polysaccharide biosynthesis protein n=1 Tax=Saccharicrinis fermentans DSM 9555 = JCM 21142 TaxID=869213 RepID=W7YLH1_9BACT|nr:oligosaccharide flippase family protein [Saccharicrinis fermentans]GAF03229.1 polysaccharide biosynthesis protein [Saccharicrinis fermentans DSM 9555 = JCM 21142]
MAESNKKQLIENTMWVYAAKMITQLLGLVATVLVIRKLPVDTYGTYTFLFGLFFVYQLFITSPVKNVLLRYIPEFRENGDGRVVRKMLGYSLMLSLFLIIVFSGVLFIFRNGFARIFHIEELDIHIKAFFVFVICYALKVLSETIIASFLKHPMSAKAGIWVMIFRSTAYFILLHKISVNILLYVEAGVSMIFVVYVFREILKQIQWQKHNRVYGNSKEIKRRVLRFYLLSFFSELGYGIIGKTSDHYIIAAMSSPFYVGLYGFALKIFEMFYKVLPFREFESILKPVFFRRFSKSGSDGEINEFYMFSIKVLVPLFMLPVCYFLLFGKGVIIHVFEAKYLPAYWVCCITLLGILLNGFFYPLNLVIQLKERVEINLYSRVIAVFSIVAGIYLMKIYGIVGVAMATVTGEFLKNVFMLFMLRRYIPIRYAPKIFIRYGLITFLIVLLLLPVSFYCASIPGWLLGSALFFLLYLVLVVNLHPLTDKDVKKLNELFASSTKLDKIYKKIIPIVDRLKINKTVGLF